MTRPTPDTRQLSTDANRQSTPEAQYHFRFFFIIIILINVIICKIKI